MNRKISREVKADFDAREKVVVIFRTLASLNIFEHSFKSDFGFVIASLNNFEHFQKGLKREFSVAEYF